MMTIATLFLTFQLQATEPPQTPPTRNPAAAAVTRKKKAPATPADAAAKAKPATPSKGDTVPPAAADSATPAEAPTPTPIMELDAKTRREMLEKDPNAVFQSVDQMPTEALMTVGERSIARLNSYQATLEKQEKLNNSKLPEPQIMQVAIREQPFAARLEVVGGPSKGRRVVYDSVANPKEMRAREGGMLGIAGALWIGIDSGLAKGDTRYEITAVGLNALMKLVRRDFELVTRAGGTLTKKTLGLNGREYCAEYTPSVAAKGLHSQKTKLCFDVISALPSFIEVNDKNGVIERYRWRDVKPFTPDAAYFTPKAAGL